MTGTLFLSHAAAICTQIVLPFGWHIRLNQTASSGMILRIFATTPDNVTHEPISWKGRKWPLSVHMTDGEIVQTAFLAMMTAMEHEARELFKFQGVAVFDPHYDIYKLVELRSQPDALKERA